MKLMLYRTAEGWILHSERGLFRLSAQQSAGLTVREDLAAFLEDLARDLAPEDGGAPGQLLPPIENQEIWAAGVTYSRSRTARIEESRTASGGDFYDLVYHAERPELFFKATPRRVVAPGQNVRIRRDATWSVPEPELALLISPGGRIIGYTIGNDMSSRDIEGQNPLYLPQAKMYDGSCSIGPGILITPDPLLPGTKIVLTIVRGANTVFSGATSLSEIKREFAVLVEYCFRETSFPDGCVLLTGTGVVPPDDFTLQHGDDIFISVDGIGTLQNRVE